MPVLVELGIDEQLENGDTAGGWRWWGDNIIFAVKYVDGHLWRCAC